MNDKQDNNKLPLFWGLGTFGCKLLKELHSQGFEGKYICIDNCELKDLPPDFIKIKYIHNIESIWNKGLDIPTYRILPNEITKFINTGSKNFLVSGLGGCTGTYLSVLLDIYFRKMNCSSFMLSTIPSTSLSELKREIAISSTTMLPENYYIDLEDTYSSLNDFDLISEISKEFQTIIKQINKSLY
jgi:hypothetical protein